MKVVQCPICTTKVKVSPKRLNSSKFITCSIKCSSIFRKSKDKNETCPICFCNFKLKPFHKKRFKGPFCCSRKCRGDFLKTHYAGKNNPNFKYNDSVLKLFKMRCDEIRNRSHKKNIPFNLTADFLYNIFNNQKGLCFYTKIPMKLHTDNWSIKGQADIDTMSVDKVDPLLGYVENNVVLCCSGINKLKGNSSKKELETFVKALIENYTKSEDL